jgi:hypothetical protein
MAVTGFQHKYPMDLETGGMESFFPEAIKFTFNKRLGVNFDGVMQDIKTKWNESGAFQDHSNRMGWLSGQFADLKSRMASRLDGGTTIKHEFIGVSTGQAAIVPQEEERKIYESYRQQFPGKGDPEESAQEIIKEGVAYLSLASDALKEVRRQNSLIDPLGSVYLNMPNNIALSEEAGWGGESLGVVGALTKGGLKSGDGDMVSSLLGAGAGSAGQILAAAGGGIVGSVLGKMGIAMGGIIGMVGGGAIQKGAEAAFSVAQNPYMEMMFSGIGFRQFKFDFVFHPRHKTEIREVGKIIQAFRKHSRPKWVGGMLGKSFMEYPQEYQIHFLTGFKGSWIPNQHLPTLKPCVCSNVETNFTPNNIWSAYKDGAPVAITLGLSFQEKELYMADDVASEWPANEAKGESSDESARSMFNQYVKDTADPVPSFNNS